MEHKQNNKITKSQMNNWWACDENREKACASLTFVITAFGLLLLASLSIIIAFYGLKYLSANLTTDTRVGGLNLYLMAAFSLGVGCTAPFVEGKELAISLFSRPSQYKPDYPQKGE